MELLSIGKFAKLKTYMIAKGYQFEIIEDIGSGINYKKQGLKNRLYGSRSKKTKKLIEDVKNNVSSN